MALYVLQCGIGNVGAILSMYRRIGVPAKLLDAPAPLNPADKLILPGVGAFDVGAAALESRGFVDFLHEAVERGNSLLGICLGMQLLCRRSEEGKRGGLGLIPADVVRIDPGPQKVRIPHMGWNIAKPVRDTPILGMNAEQRFYFTHSYRAECDDPADVIATTDYGEVFPSAIGRGQVMGVQFHPEKSHRFGMAVLKRFAEMGLANA